MTDDTILHRQVHPSWIQNDRVTSQAFKPTAKDKGKLSVYDGDRITAEKAWRHFTTVLKFESVGSLALNVRECIEVELPVEPDPQEFFEHVVINFSAYGRGEVEKKAKHLRFKAEARGWQYRAI
ncbi:MAG TPA: hypothetical protein VMD30_01500 [Tepidisphaeraceae bacterium]|nr:hypothetical protein [Tepidisphaeraceae bacterium]